MTKILKKFWVFEGLDGAGTTTQQKILVDKLNDEGIKCFKTQEPTSFETGIFLRNILSGNIEVSQSTIAYLFAADRDNHINNSIDGVLKHIGNGEIVISDRYLFSSLAYQSIGFPYEKVKNINSDFPYPELIIFLDTPVESCLERINSRGNQKEIYEKYDYQKMVAEGYRKCLSSLPEGCHLIEVNGNEDITSISETIYNSVKKYL